jgi:hypothetical protein
MNKEKSAKETNLETFYEKNPHLKNNYFGLLAINTEYELSDSEYQKYLDTINTNKLKVEADITNLDTT